MYSFFLVGNGNVAYAFARYFQKKNIFFSWFKPDEKNHYFLDRNQSKEKKIYLFAIPDGSIIPLWDRLTLKHPDNIYVSLSGTTKFSLLNPALIKNTVCLHPMYSFIKGNDTNLLHIPFTLQGNERMCREIHKHFSDLSITDVVFDAVEAYHLLGVFASNFQIAVMSICQRLAEKNNISLRELKKIILPIFYQTIKNIEEKTFLKDALSGPLKRGDQNTIEQHRTYLKGFDLELLQIYDLLTKELIRLLS